MRVGLTLFDFLASRGVAVNALPARFTNSLEIISLDIAEETETAAFLRWRGTLPAKEFLEEVLGGRAIGIETLSWRFTQLRDTTAVPDGDVENPPVAHELRIDLTGARVELPNDLGISLHPAEEVSARGTDTAHLRALPGEDRTALVGDLAFRIVQSGDAAPQVGLAGADDPFRAFDDTGAVASLRLDPPAAVFTKDDGFGIVVDGVQIDASKGFTPPQIAAGDPSWTGFRLERVGLYLPHSIPLFGNLNIVAEEFLVPTGDTARGLQGKVTVETGRLAGGGATIRFTQTEASIPADKSLPVEWVSSGDYTVRYHQIFDQDRDPIPIFITAQSPVAEGTWQLLRGGRVVDSKPGAVFGPFLPDAETELRYKRQSRDADGPDFQLLKRPGQTPPADGREDFPVPAQTFRFVPVADPPAALWQINAESDTTTSIESIAYLTATVSDLTSLRFSVTDQGGNAPPETPKWSVWKEGTLPGKGDATALHEPTEASDTFSWDGWRDGTTVSLIARISDRESRRLLVTPRPDGPLLAGHNRRRDAGNASPRITVVDGIGQRGITPDMVSADAVWRKKVLQDIQDAALFGMGRGKPADAQVPGADGTFSVGNGDVLLVPVIFGTPAEPTEALPERQVLKKRVLLMEYDTQKPLRMLNDGIKPVPEGRLTSGGPKEALATAEWLSKSAAVTATSGQVWPGDATEKDPDAEKKAIAKATRMLANWIIEQELGGVSARLFVVAHTSPEGSKSHNEKLSANKRLPRGMEIARAAIDLVKAESNGPNIDITGRAEHGNRHPAEPPYSNLIGSSAVALKGSKDQQQQVQPLTYARRGQMGKEDDSDLWIGTRADIKSEDFQIERNVTFILSGIARAKLPVQPPDTTRLVPVLVPGAEGEPPQPVDIDTDGVATPWRLRAEMVWDAPRYQDSDDLIPLRTKVELVLPRTVLPGVPASDTTHFSVMGQILRDRQIAETEVTLGISAPDHPEGLMEFRQGDVTAGGIAFAMFGPALLKALTAGESDPALPEEDAQDGLARGIAAGVSIASAGILSTAMQDGRIVWTGARLSGSLPLGRAAFAVDYLTEANIRARPLGNNGPRVETTEPVAFAWSDVGVKVDWRPDDPQVDLSGTAAYFQKSRVEIVSSGRWTISNILGDLVDLRDVQFENTSAALSARVVPTKPLGPLKVDAIGLTARWTETPREVSVHITEVAATLNIAKVIEASGALRFGDEISGSLSVEIPPAQIAGAASVSIRGEDPAMVHLEAEIRFASPIPVGSTGLSVMGVAGRFVANGERATDQTITDIVARELDWARKGPLDRYQPKPGQYGIGFGVLLGTTPDIGFSLNAKGMLTVGFPDLEAVVQADIKLVERRSAPPAEEDAPKADADILALLVVNDEGVTIAAEGNVTIPGQIKAYIPIGAHFPFGVGDFYIHLGSDGGPDRSGNAITATIFPGTLNVDGWAFVMIREGGIPDLGGDRAEGLDLTGFSVGAGIGIGFDREFGPFSVNASASMIAGVGFDPLIVVARLQVNGEIDFFVASVHLSAGLDLHYSPDALKISGWIEGSVSLFWFDLEASVFLEETFGGGPGPTELPGVLRSIRLTDQSDRILAETDPENPAAMTDIPVDSIINLEFFPTPLIRGLQDFKTPDPRQIEANWVGSTGERYGYEITGIALDRLSGPAGSDLVLNQPGGPLPAEIIRPTDGNEGQADAGRALRLGLFANTPVPWLGNLSRGTDQTDAIADDVVDGLCDPVVRERVTLFGTDMSPVTPGRWWGRSRGPVEAGFRGYSKLSQSVLRGAETGIELITGVALPDDGLLDLPTLRSAMMGTRFSVRAGEHLERGPGIFPAFPEGALMLPCLMRDDQPFRSLPVEIELRGQVRDPVVTLISDLAARRAAEEDARPEKFCPRKLKPSPRKVTKRQVDDVLYQTRGSGFVIEDSPGVMQNAVLFGGASADVLDVGFPADGAGFEFELDARSRLSQSGIVTVSILNKQGAQLWQERLRLRRFGTAHMVRAPQRAGARILRIAPLGADVTLHRVCQIVRLPETGEPQPRVLGIDHRGAIHEWPVEKTGQTGGPTGLGGFTWKSAPNVSGRRWKSILLERMPHSWVAFEKLEALSVAADDAATAIQTRRTSRAGNFADRAILTGSPTSNQTGITGDIPVLDTVPPQARPPLLFPDSEYRLRIKSRGAIWRKGEDSETAPQTVADGFATSQPPGVTAPQNLPDIDITFRTAPPAMALERARAAFDRALPDDPRGAHYTDDAMAVLFTSTIAPELIELSGAKLKFRVRRTDPRGAGAEVAPDQMQLTRTGGNRDIWPGGHGAFADALADKAPCVTGTPTVGETMLLDVPLDPDASYLLDVFAQDAAGKDTEFGQSRFRTSRYSGPEAQLAAMGLSTGEPDLLPDLLLRTHPRPGNEAPSDLTFEKACADLELDPEPPAFPQAQALWVFDGGWKLSGLRLSSPEALNRQAVLFDSRGISRSDERLKLHAASMTTPAGDTRLRLVQRDAQGARWIFAFDTPVAVPADAEFRVEFIQRGHVWQDGILVHRPRALNVRGGLRSVPLVAEIEGLT
ncbi:hypothetical protein [uncultured Roseobacter sp.]|uniref:hypothetical protein n=1 Tax=uncultured Roseobacter sp. TaxID=114847 RepID=UPI002639ABB9|nr:hypothetical protein [uncultured Roseobacter sp.]